MDLHKIGVEAASAAEVLGVSSGNAKAVMDEVNAGYQTLNSDIGSSSKVRAVFRDAWDTFFKAWTAFYAENQEAWYNIFGYGASDKKEQAEAYRAKLLQWRDGYQRETGAGATGPSPEAPSKPFPWSWVIIPTAIVIGIVAAAGAVGSASKAIRGVSDG